MALSRPGLTQYTARIQNIFCRVMISLLFGFYMAQSHVHRRSIAFNGHCQHLGCWSAIRSAPYSPCSTKLKSKNGRICFDSWSFSKFRIDISAASFIYASILFFVWVNMLTALFTLLQRTESYAFLMIAFTYLLLFSDYINLWSCF